RLLRERVGAAPASVPSPLVTDNPIGVTITQALDAWLAKRAKDDEPPRPQTVEGHRQRVRAPVQFCGGGVALTANDRATAAGFLASLDCGNGTRNQYVMTLKAIFESARTDGAFPKTADNPFADQRRKVKRAERLAYTDAQAVALFDAFGPREIAPAKHTVETALPGPFLSPPT